MKGDALSKIKHWTIRIAVAIGLFALAGFIASRAIESYCNVTPPALEHTPHVAATMLEEKDGCRRIQNSYLKRQDGILRMYLEGNPYELGFNNGALSAPYVQAQEEELMGTVRRAIPSDSAFWLVRKLVIVRNRNLPSFVPAEYRAEIFGLSQGYPDPLPALGPLYHRLLNYHAAHDISQSLIDSPLLGGCTSFAAWGGYTADGHLLIGRNFDFDAGECFDKNKLVLRVKPEQGLGFLSVAWPGMVGTVTGINEAKIAVTIHAARSESKRTIGTPVSLVLRQVMQYANSLQQAEDIIRASAVFVSDSFLLADGKTGEAIIIEKTPAATVVRHPHDAHMVCANHFVSDDLKSDRANETYRIEGTSEPRLARMDELVRANVGKLTPQIAADILRDTRLPGGIEVGLGNPAAINPLIAVHSAIIDVTEGIMWVSAGPHQLGAYVPFGLDAFEDPPGKAIIAADPALTDGRYDRYVAAMKTLTHAEERMKHKDWAAAMPLLVEAETAMPGYYRPAFLLAQVALKTGDIPKAESYLQTASAQHPAYASERKKIEDMQRRIATRKKAS